MTRSLKVVIISSICLFIALFSVFIYVGFRVFSSPFRLTVFPLSSPKLNLETNFAFCPMPDDSKIVFTGSGEGGSDLYLLDQKTSRVSVLLKSKEQEYQPAVSPDGKQVVFASKTPGALNWNLSILNLSTGKVRMLTHSKEVNDMMPSFSKDGKKILFARAVWENVNIFEGRKWYRWDVWQMNAEGTGEARLTRKQYSEITPPHYALNEKVVCYSGTSRNNPTLNNKVYSFVLKPLGNLIQIDCNGFLQYDPHPSLDGKRYLSIDNVLGDYNCRVVEHFFGQKSYRILDTVKFSGHPESPIYAQDGESAYYLGDPVSFDRPRLLKLNLHTGVSTSILDFTLFEDPLKGMSGNFKK